jgi:hypothetical protein
MQRGVHNEIAGGVEAGGITNQTQEDDVFFEAHPADASAQRLPVAPGDITIQVATSQEQQWSRSREPSPGGDGDVVAMDRMHVCSDRHYRPTGSNSKPISGNVDVEHGRPLHWIRDYMHGPPTS